MIRRGGTPALYGGRRDHGRLPPAEEAAPAVCVFEYAGRKLSGKFSVCLFPGTNAPGELTVALFREGAKDPEGRREGESDRAYAARTAILPRQTRILVIRRQA